MVNTHNPLYIVAFLISNIKGLIHGNFYKNACKFRRLRWIMILGGNLFFSVLSLFSQDIDRFIDSIEQQNLYAHDTVKIKNYIKLYESVGSKNPDTSLYFINKAIKIDSLGSTNKYLGKLLILKAKILTETRKYNQSLEVFKIALEQAEKINNKELIVDIYLSIGSMYINLNLYEEAFSNFILALSNCNKETQQKIYSSILINLGYVYQLQNKYEKALEYFKQSFEIYKSINDKGGMASSYNNIGSSYFYLGSLDSVIIYFHKALKIYEELQNKKIQAIPIFNIGETYYELNQYDKAISYILKAYEIDKEFNDQQGMAQSLNFLGKIYSKKGYYQYALVFYNQALELCQEINDKYELKEIYYNLSENYSKLNNCGEALRYYKLYNQVKDTLINLESTQKMFELETKYQTEQQRNQIERQQLTLENKESEIKQQRLQKITILAGFVLLFIFFLFIYRSYRLKNKSNALLVRQNEQIESQNHKITSSIQYAKLIQTAALPPHDLLKSIFSQHFVLFLPRDIVSGDFFWATHKDNYSVIACADCTGHGVPGAFMSMLGVSFLTEIVNRSEKLKADAVLEDLRQNIIESLHQTGKIGESRDGMDIALCIVNHERTQIEYAGAFIPLVIIRDHNIIQVPADKMPIGVHDEIQTPFTSHTVRLQKDDMVYIFTDGYADQFGGPFNKKFKMQPFLSLLLAQHNRPLVQQREILYDTIMSWKGENDQVDDILIMGFRV